MNKKWYRIVNASKSHTDIYIYDEIGGWGYKAGDFAKDFANIDGDVVLHINSPGGDVFDGIAMYNLIKAHTGNVTVLIEGLAASIASIIALSGDAVKIASSGMMMIHKPWSFIAGDSEDLQKQAEILEQVENLLVKIYVNKTGIEEAEIKQMLKEETWLTANEAKDKGFVSEVIEPVKNQLKTFEDCNFQNQTKYKQYLSKINKIKPKGAKMDELLNLLGVANEKDAIIKVKALQSNTLSLQEKLNAQTIETAVQNKQILPSQKGFALNLLNQSKDMYNQFIEGNKIPDLTAKVDLEEPEIEVPVTASNVKNFEQLLNDEKLHDEFKKTNPKAYAQLYKNYHEGE